MPGEVFDCCSNLVEYRQQEERIFVANFHLQIEIVLLHSVY